jgi:hypothetical protein
MRAPLFNLYFRCTKRNTIVNNIGSNPGYISKLSITLPLKISSNERCIPQPGHSNPKKYLFGQVNKCCSSQSIQFIYQNVFQIAALYIDPMNAKRKITYIMYKPERMTPMIPQTFPAFVLL